VPGLLACPFCRALFRDDEGVARCPDCGLDLVAAATLPPSPEVLAEDEAAMEALHPEDRPLARGTQAWASWPLVAVSWLGLVAFVMPWVELTSPHRESLSGWLLAWRGSTWLWGGAVAWIGVTPLVLSRRTERQLRDARVLAPLLAAMTGAEVTMLLALPPRGHPLVPYEYRWAYGLYASGLLSAVGIWLGARLGSGLRPRAVTRRPEPGPVEGRAPPDAPLH